MSDYSKVMEEIREQDLRFMKPFDEMTNKEVIDEYINHGIKYIEPFRVIGALRDDPRNLMDSSDYELYLKLPEEVTIYRGCDLDELDEEGYPIGVSWTLDEKVAEFFAYRFNNESGCVVKAKVAKEDVRCLRMDRSEAEVMVLPFSIEEPEIVSKGVMDYDCTEFHKHIGR